MKLNITKEFLEKEYLENKKTILQIAKELNKSYTYINDRLIKFNIPKRRSWEHRYGFIVTEEVKEKIRFGNLGKRYSEETKQKMRGSKSKKHRGNISKANKGRIPWNKDKINVYSKETLIKMSETKIKKGLFKLENNPNWLGGKSFEPYPLGWNKTFKEQIRYRDRYKCQVCGCSETENDKQLAVHHIDYNKMNIDVNNLISLCNVCHNKTNFNREYWINYFKKEEKNKQEEIVK